MDGENNVINDGNVMVRDGKITGVWASNTNPPAGVDFTDVPIVETEGTIYPGLIDLHNPCPLQPHTIYGILKFYTLVKIARNQRKVATPIDISGVITGIMAQVSLG